MASFVNRLLRGMVVGVMLLLAATASLVSFSYDADDDDDTPPITIELSIVAPAKRPAHLIKQQSPARVSHLRDEETPASQIASAELEPVLLLAQGSPQLVIPLRR